MTHTDWKPIPGYAGYEASVDGRVRSVSRLVRRGNGLMRVRGRVMKSHVSKSNGYRTIGMSGKPATVHRLVCLAFYGEPGNARNHVNHRDGDKTNNHAANLEWVTPSENNAHAINCGLRPLKISERDRNIIRAAVRSGATRSSMAAKYGVSPSTITNIMKEAAA